MSLKPLEVWGGVECTVNRVGDVYFDQLEWTGHGRRVDDIDRIADLGIRTLRYPVLWERLAPDENGDIQWDWADERIARLRELGIRPIVGLVHHGGGPRYTSLLDPKFPERLANFARAVAERYPWVDHYTPVNEPLTTARFSGLYGHWYPHARDDLSFLRALLAECRATVLAMRAIREVNSAARLVQTEDLGKTFSTPRLTYQAEFENERRWLSLDLLFGRVDRHHPMWEYLAKAGVSPGEVEQFLETTCPPDILGFNYYITSERFIDERLEHYPAHTHGGNGRHAYADVEAVRVLAEGTARPGRLLREAWERFGHPVALTEVQLGDTRDEQLRWLMEVWSDVRGLRAQGVDVRAITVWSMFGACNWNLLVTSDASYYEPGTFDVRAAHPRPTLLARAVRELTSRGEFSHPVLDVPGWWHRPERLHYPPFNHGEPEDRFEKAPALHLGRTPPRPLLITGRTGTLGRAFQRICLKRGLSHQSMTRRDMDIADPHSVEQALEEIRPWAVVNAAGYVRVDDAEREPERCRRENTKGPAVLAEACARRGLPLLTFSSDLVFKGDRSEPYLEDHFPAPLNVYGLSKADSETRVLQAFPEALVIRTSAFFGPWDEHNFVTIALRALTQGRPFVAADDTVISPTYVPDLVHASLDLLIDGESGVWHLSNRGALTWADLAQRAARTAGVASGRVEGRPLEAMGFRAPRPRYSALGSRRGELLPALDDALERFCRDCEVGI